MSYKVLQDIIALGNRQKDMTDIRGVFYTKRKMLEDDIRYILTIEIKVVRTGKKIFTGQTITSIEHSTKEIAILKEELAQRIISLIVMEGLDYMQTRAETSW